MQQTPIETFQGAYRWLSNFWPCPVRYEGVTYPSVEHAYQAAKTTDMAARVRIAYLPRPGQAKRAGRKVALRRDWEQVKEDVMLSLLRLKFAPGSELADALSDTRQRPLVEGNRWGDRYWGVCEGEGRNRLGELLMRVRAERRRNNG